MHPIARALAVVLTFLLAPSLACDPISYLVEMVDGPREENRAEIATLTAEVPLTATFLTRTFQTATTVFEVDLPTATPTPTLLPGSGTGVPSRTPGPPPTNTLIAPNAPPDIPIIDGDVQLVEASPEHLAYTTDGFFEKFEPYFGDAMAQQGWTNLPDQRETDGATTLHLEFTKDERLAVLTVAPDLEPGRWLVTVDITGG
jgi:hypothetical protein